MIKPLVFFMPLESAEIPNRVIGSYKDLPTKVYEHLHGRPANLAK